MGATQRRARASLEDSVSRGTVDASSQPKLVVLDRKSHRALRGIVYVARAVGWILMALAIANALSFEFSGSLAGGFKLLVSLVLGVLGIAWIVGLELFLRFFDRYLSRN